MKDKWGKVRLNYEQASPKAVYVRPETISDCLKLRKSKQTGDGETQSVTKDEREIDERVQEGAQDNEFRELRRKVCQH